MQLEQIERTRPFSNGSQHMDFESSNCDRCTKRFDEESSPPRFRCEIQQAIGEAGMSDGTVNTSPGGETGSVNRWPTTCSRQMIPPGPGSRHCRQRVRLVQ